MTYTDDCDILGISNLTVVKSLAAAFCTTWSLYIYIYSIYIYIYIYIYILNLVEDQSCSSILNQCILIQCNAIVQYNSESE